MFAREYLSVVNRWARDQLRQEVQTAAARRHLRQLIKASEALGAQLPPPGQPPQNVVRLADHKRKAATRARRRLDVMLSFLDN
ncbi:MAG: hypothetical protein R3C30_10900 [Hyphomonadaceae bacterium]